MRVCTAVLLLVAGCGGPVPEEEIGPPRMDGVEASRPVETPGAPATRAPGWAVPPEWRETTPTSSMRVLQATIPGSAGQGEVVVFFFGEGQGGSVEANLDRWLGQIDVDGAPRREAFGVGDYQVSMLEAAGTLLPSPMAGIAEPRPGSKMLGAVVEGPGGPWFVKATGPAATIEENRDVFIEFLRSFSPPR